MNTPAPSEKNDQYVVLFVRIPKELKKLLIKKAKKKNVHLSNYVEEVLYKDVPQDPVVVHLIENIEQDAESEPDMLAIIQGLLTTQNKQVFTDLGEILAMVKDIYATQTAAKTEEEQRQVPTGVILLPASKEKGTFYCQGPHCGRETPNRRKHVIKVGFDEYSVGDCCFFNDKYKELVRAVL